MQTKTLDFKFEIKQLEEDGTIEGYGAVFGNRDSHHDIIERGAFTSTLSEKSPKDIKMLWQHNSEEPIGKWLEIKEDERGLFCKGKLLLKLPKAQQVYDMLKEQLIDGMSIGYNPVDFELDKDNEDITRRLTELDLWEISIVTFPSNKFANITDVKAISHTMNLPIAPKDRVWDKSSADSRIRKFTDSEDKPNISYRNNFMYFDEENKDNFGAYLLPFTDIIEGKVHIIPRAVFAMSGGKGVKEIIKEKVNTLYARFRKEFDDDTLISPFEDKKSIIEKWELKEFDRFLKNSSLSNSDIKIFRKRYLELHPAKEEKKEEIKKDDDDKNKIKSPEGIKKQEESPAEKEEENIQKEIPVELKKRYKNILQNLQNLQNT